MDSFRAAFPAVSAVKFFHPSDNSGGKMVGGYGFIGAGVKPHER